MITQGIEEIAFDQALPLTSDPLLEALVNSEVNEIVQRTLDREQIFHSVQTVTDEITDNTVVHLT